MNCLSCHFEREGSGGVIYSYASLGVLCPKCEALDWEYQMQAEFEALPKEEQIRLEIAGRWRKAISQMPKRRPGSPAHHCDPDDPWGVCKDCYTKSLFG